MFEHETERFKWVARKKVSTKVDRSRYDIASLHWGSRLMYACTNTRSFRRMVSVTADNGS